MEVQFGLNDVAMPDIFQIQQSPVGAALVAALCCVRPVTCLP